MSSVITTEVPANSLLERYASGGAYADCYATDMPGPVSQEAFVEAFYTTPLFKLERMLLAVFARCASTDGQARLLAQGRIASFAMWSVEDRAADELLLASGRTRSWLMVTTSPGVGATRLHFGSAIVPKRSASGERGGMGVLFGALLGFHKLYSRALLASARAGLTRRRRERSIEEDITRE